MINELIQLDDATTAVADLESLLQPRNKTVLLVLGNTPERRRLAADAVAQTEPGAGFRSSRYAVLATVPDAIYPRLLELPTDNAMLPPVFTGAGMYAVALAMDGTICSVLTSTTDADIALAYLLAETH